MLTDEQLADGWIEHDGNARPVTLRYPAKVMFRDGLIETAQKAGDFRWRHVRGWLHPNGHFIDIIAYRPETPND